MLNRLWKIEFPEEFQLANTPDELRRIRLTNYISFIALCNMLLYIGVYSLLDFSLFRSAIILLSSVSFLTLFVFFLNKKGFYNAAKIIISVIMPLVMTSVATWVFGKDPGFQVFLLLGATIPIFLWSTNDKGFLIFFLSLNIGLYVFVEFLPEFVDHQIILENSISELFKTTNTFICFLGLAAAIGIYQYNINVKEKQLIKQAEELKISQQHKDIVYSIIAHDLRGPVGSFVGLTEFYLENFERLDSRKLKETFYKLNGVSIGVQSLLENLLDWSKMHSGSMPINFENLDLNNIVEDIIKLHDELFRRKKQIVEIIIDPEIRVFGDKYMVSTIFRNLISNAIKFTPWEGTIKIMATQEQERVRICICDSGIGISENDLKEIFKIQKSMEADVPREDRGSGLGLLICKDFVELNKGHIWVESELEKGSKFYFTLKKASS